MCQEIKKSRNFLVEKIFFVFCLLFPAARLSSISIFLNFLSFFKKYLLSALILLSINYPVSLAHGHTGGHIVVLSTVPNVLYYEILNDIPKSQKSIILKSDRFKESDIALYKSSFENVIVVPDYFDSSKVDRAVYELNSKNKLHRIVGIAENDILRAGRIRDFLKITGQSYTSAVAFRDKSVMKELLKKAEILIPKYRKVYNIFDVLQFANENGYPIIVKPLRGQGAISTIVLHGDDDLVKLVGKGVFNADHTGDLEVETFVDGDMYHINGLVMNGKVVFVHPSKYIGHCRDTTNSMETLGSYVLEYGNPLTESLKEYAIKVIKNLPTPTDTAFHLEVFHEKKSGKFVFCEIASRIGGAYVNDDCIHSFGFDLRTAHIRLSAGLKLDVDIKNIPIKPKKIAGFVMVPRRKGIILSMPDKVPFDWVSIYNPKVKVGDTMDDPNTVIDNIATFHFCADSECQFKERYIMLMQWFNNNLKVE